MLAALVVATSSLAAVAAPTNTSWRVRLTGPRCSADAITNLGFDDVAVGGNRTTFDVFFDHAELAASERALARGAATGCAVTEREQGRPGRDVLVPEGYRTPEEIQRLMELLALTHPGYAALIDLTEELGTPPTVEGRHIYALKVSDNADEDEDEPNLLLVGMHHAREIMGPETVLLVAERLLEDGGDDIKKLVAGTQIYLAWDWNPDGWRYVFDVDNSWRKNRLPNPDGSFGVDLNRNYPFGWDFTCGGSTQMSSNSYRGPSAASEPEVQTMIAWQESRRFAKIIDLHSSGRDVRQNYAACAALPDPIDSMYTELVTTVATDMNYIPVRSCCTGGEISFAFSTHGTLSMLFEQGRSFQPPFADTMEELELENLPGILNFFSRPIPAFGHVRDAASGAPIPDAQLRSTNFEWNYDESVATNRFGSFHLWLPSGTWQINMTAPGYEPAVVDVEASTESGVERELELTPSRSQS